MTVNKLNILIILPAFNEAAVISDVLLGIQKEGYCNICLIDDGSTDDTLKIVQEYDINILKHPLNRGAGAATQTGITFAKMEGFEYAILMDSDGQHFPQDIENLIKKMNDTNADIVIGNRFMNSDNSIPGHRVAFNRIANYFTNFFCKNNYADTQSGFRLLNRKSIETLNLKNRDFGFCSEMLFVSEKLGLRIEQTPIRVLYTKYSMNKGQNLREGVRTARTILWRVFFG